MISRNTAVRGLPAWTACLLATLFATARADDGGDLDHLDLARTASADQRCPPRKQTVPLGQVGQQLLRLLQHAVGVGLDVVVFPMEVGDGFAQFAQTLHSLA